MEQYTVTGMSCAACTARVEKGDIFVVRPDENIPVDGTFVNCRCGYHQRGQPGQLRKCRIWAFIYNMIGIPLAAGAFIGVLGWKLDPMFAAMAMSLSSFSVVTNALRLNFFRIHDSKRDHKIKNKSEITTEKEIKTMEKTLKIEGMMCGHCEMHVKKALEAIDGVTEALVSHQTGSAVVTLEKNVSEDVLKQAVTDQGYQVK